MKYFYNHLIEIESIVVELDKLSLDQEQKMYLSKLIDSFLQHTILDIVLSQLSLSDKKVFINYLNKGDHAKIWQFLNERIDDVEDKIKKSAEGLKVELLKDFKGSKK